MNFSFMASTVEEKKLSQIQKTQYSLAKNLFSQARKINVCTPQKQLCNLLSKTSSFVVTNTHYVSEVKELHMHLSHCLECIYNGENWAFEDLDYFLCENKVFL